MLKTLAHHAACGRVSEPAPATDDALRASNALHDEIWSILGRALCIRHVDAGSCNGCELEIQPSTTPSTTSRGSGSASSQAQGTPTCCS